MFTWTRDRFQEIDDIGLETTGKMGLSHHYEERTLDDADSFKRSN